MTAATFPARRCAICGNDRWHARAVPECTHCGLGVADPHRDPAVLRREIAATLNGPVGKHVDGDGWRLAGHALRNALWALGRVVADGVAMPAVPTPADVTLGMIARGAEWQGVAAMLDALLPRFAGAVIVLDGDAAKRDALAGRCPAAIVVAHPLDGDFARQRNRVQALSHGWVLQLDADEWPEPELLSALGWVTKAADADGLVSLGLPRRNLVDGEPSALWPDIQYRLNRAEVRFAGTVHERPDVPFARTSLALAGAIRHRLSGDRVRERSRVYEAMSTGAGRPGDEAALLRPFVA